MTDITQTLKERGERYGDFLEHSAVTQQMKHACTTGKSYTKLSPAQKESLDMICHKIGRIVNGDPNHADSWHDIAGYSKLAEDSIKNS